MSAHNSHKAIAAQLHDVSSLSKLLIIGCFFVILTILPRLLPDFTFKNQFLVTICITITFFTNLITEIIIFFLRKSKKEFHPVLTGQIIANTILLMAFLTLIDHINGPLFLICGLTLMESYLNLNLIMPRIVGSIMLFCTITEWLWLTQTGQISPSLFEIVTLLVRIIFLLSLMSYGRSLAQSIIAAYEVDRMKDEFLSVASHELRTPMTIIKSYLYMALNDQKGKLTSDQSTYLNRALLSTDRLIKLVNDLLNVSRIEANRFTLHLQSLDIKSLIAEIIEETTPKFLENKVQLIFKPPISTLKVFADPDKIREVIVNLLGNSLKFTPPKGKVTISLAKLKNELVISVSDTGVGIDKANLSTLFQKFGLISSSYVVSKTASGSGLGLYICKSIVELHHGVIWAKSAGKNKGTTISFTLKLATPQNSKEFEITSLQPLPSPAT
jgi:signal transduction histidine kinase